ncbi:MAG: DNA repair protein RecN [Oscillospiraceae bacterium]|nr:DNA repair protein RecN [Oscillospiraceae bacterium]
MLEILHIENVAVIESADIEFSHGLNVLTGETGAGKSIVIDSIGAVTGSKLSREIIRKGCDAATVSASFSLSPEAAEWLDQNDYASDDELLISRKITSDGRNSCRINGRPASVSQLKDLSNCLIDIHGQNDGRLLLDERSHLNYLDSFGGFTELLEQYRCVYAEYGRLTEEIEALQVDDLEKSRLSDSLSFAIDELEAAQISPGEYDSLLSKRDLLRNSEKLTENIQLALETLDGESDTNVSSLIRDCSYYLDKAASISNDLSVCSDKLGEASFLISDITETLRDYIDALDFSEEQYNALEMRISQLSRLFRKYNRDEDDLISYLDECHDKLDKIRYSDVLLEKYRAERDDTAGKCLSMAEKLSEARKTAAGILQKKIEEQLKDLNMPSVRFYVDFSAVEKENGFDKDGIDRVRFLMSANAGEDPGKISRIASGGELSRIMLALKNVFSEKDPVPTLIFDEIDSGVSGIAGQKVAEKLYNVAISKQVLCVSHLPQIAAMADQQFLIEKSEKDGRTYTSVEPLDFEGRKHELARLYGGEHITATTVRSAEEQLGSAQAYKNSIGQMIIGGF